MKSRPPKLAIIVLAILFIGFLGLIGTGYYFAGKFLQPESIERLVAGQMGAAGQPEVSLPEPDADLMSRPEDPWSIEPVPVESLLLVMPFSRDGVYDDEGYAMQTYFMDQFGYSAERHHGIMRTGYITGMISRMTTYARGHWAVEEKVTQAIKVLVQPTHTLEGVYMIENGEWVIEAILSHPEGKERKTFRVEEGDYFLAASKVMPWVAEAPGMNTSPENIERISKKFLGEKITSWNSDYCLEALSDPFHPLWETLAENPPPLYQIGRTFAALETDDKTLLRKLDPGPLAEDAPVWMHLERILMLEGIEKRAEKIHEEKLMLSKFPGWIPNASSFVYEEFGKGEMREDYIDTVRKWHKRAPGFSSYPDVVLAGAMKKSAWDYRGSGFVGSVSRTGWQMFHEYSRDSIEIYVDVVDQCGASPYIAGEMTSLYGSNSQERSMWAIHEKNIAEFPGSIDSYWNIVHYTRPRWGGTHAQAMRVVGDAMDDNPDIGRMGRLALHYHRGEASLSYYDRDPFQYLKNYAADDPAAKEQLLKAIKHLGKETSRKEDAAQALVICTMLRDYDAGVEVMRNHPDLYNSVHQHVREKWAGGCMFISAYGHASLGNWEKLREITDEALEHDPPYDEPHKAARVGYKKYFQSETIRNLYAGVAEVMTGDEEKGFQRLAPLGKDNSVLVFYAQIHAGRFGKEGRERLANEIQTDQDSLDHPLLMAMVLAKEENIEEAEKYYNLAMSRGDEPWPALHEEVAGLLDIDLSLENRPSAEINVEEEATKFLDGE